MASNVIGELQKLELLLRTEGHRLVPVGAELMMEAGNWSNPLTMLWTRSSAKSRALSLEDLGETEQATEWGLRTSVIALVETLQRRSADYQFFDSVIELADYYRGTNVDGAAETFFCPASIAAGNILVEGAFGASRTGLTEEISRSANLQLRSGVCVLNVAATLVLKSLEPDAPQNCLKETSPQSEFSDDTSRQAPLPLSGEARIHGDQVDERRGAGQKENKKCEALLAIARGISHLKRKPDMALRSQHAFES